MEKPGNSKELKIAVWTGGTLTVVVALVVVAYGIYYASQEFFGSPDVPIAIQVAVPVAVVGAVILLGVVLVERLRRRKQEGFQEVEY